MTAFLCEFSSTRIGVPFGFYYYNGATVGEELYIADVPFMDSLSFAFLLFASYCLALGFCLPSRQSFSPYRLRLLLDPAIRTAWPALVLTAAFLTFIDVVIDPVALRGDRWFLGLIYGYPDPGVYFGIPLMNFVGWAVVGLIALSIYFVIDRRSATTACLRCRIAMTRHMLLGCGLYYGVLTFNLTITFWIGESSPRSGRRHDLFPGDPLVLLRLFNRFPDR